MWFLISSPRCLSERRISDTYTIKKLFSLVRNAKQYQGGGRNHVLLCKCMWRKQRGRRELNVWESLGKLSARFSENDSIFCFIKNTLSCIITDSGTRYLNPSVTFVWLPHFQRKSDPYFIGFCSHPSLFPTHPNWIEIVNKANPSTREIRL